MHITKKVRLIPALFVGTRIKIKLEDPESLTWGMSMLTLHEDRERAIIDWGDGSRTELSETGEAIHDYAAPGEYEIKITDDIQVIQCSSSLPGSAFRKVYAPMICEFWTTAVHLMKIGDNCFTDATNLSAFNLEGLGVSELGSRAVSMCVSLEGRIDLPGINTLAKNSLLNSNYIEEIHFSKKNEERIQALDGYTSAFGAKNATISFDL